MTETADRLTAALSDRYRIERELGAGGMATVYLAHDIRHERDVAIKVLHPDLGAALGGERFLSEIRTTAKLQHPHILPLLDSGDADGLLYYVMPLVTGETLRSRLERERQLPIDDAVRIAREVADALGSAHALGIIHRDIKPENILLQGGHALVADFGIALAVQTAGGTRMTQTGLSLGTPQYMSPEQAMGEKQIDARSDIYALGAVTYEMLVGEAPFTGGSVQAIVAKIMTERPTAIHTLRDTVPEYLEYAVHVALAKLPADRYASAQQFADALVVGPSRSIGIESRANPLHLAGVSRRVAVAIAGAAALVAVAITVLALGALRGSSSSDRVMKVALAFPPGQELLSPGGTRFAWAPDGGAFVYPGPGTGLSRLLMRRLDDLEATPIDGSEGATSPAFSPDGQEIAFIALSPFSIRIVPRAGGEPRTVVADGVSGGGLVWASDGFLYVDGGTGLARLHPDGTGWEIVMPLDTADGETGIAWPSMLPETRGLLVRIRRAGEASADWRIYAFDLRDRSRKELVRGVFARYSPSGHLIWVTADGTLHAQRFDVDRLALVGTAVALWPGIGLRGFGATDLAVSTAGDLLYVPGAAQTAFAGLVWVTREGVKTPVDSAIVDGLIGDIALAPDGSAVALEMLRPSDASGVARIWVKRLGGGPTQLATSDATGGIRPSWTSDSRDLMYLSNGGLAISRRRADGSGSAASVLRLPAGVVDFTLHPDGRTIVFRAEAVARRQRTLHRFRIGVDSIPSPLLANGIGGSSPAFSPDGTWLAYVSTESGREEVYARPFPDAETRKVQISVDGGKLPRWNPAGGELFYLSASGQMMAAQVTTTPALTVTAVNRLFTPVGYQGTQEGLMYEPSPDGRRFLMLDIAVTGGAATGERAVVVQNFAAELARRVP